MEYEDLVEYYKRKLLEQYKASLARPEMTQIREKLEKANEETLREVLKLLER